MFPVDTATTLAGMDARLRDVLEEIEIIDNDGDRIFADSFEG